MRDDKLFSVDVDAEHQPRAFSRSLVPNVNEELPIKLTGLLSAQPRLDFRSSSTSIIAFKEALAYIPARPSDMDPLCSGQQFRVRRHFRVRSVH